MKITVWELSIINLVLQVDWEGKSKQYPLSELTTASDIFKEIKKCVGIIKNDKWEDMEVFKDWEIELTSEQKVFITKLIDERSWTVGDAEFIFKLKSLIK